MGVGNQRHAPSVLLPRKRPRYTLYRSLGGPQGLCGQVRKISPLPEFDPRTVQTVASIYTDWAIVANHNVYKQNVLILSEEFVTKVELKSLNIWEQL